MLADKLRAKIRADGPMPFEEYMDACLYDEEFGFFTTGPLRSVKDGDFLTSPEVSPWFGRMLARFVAKEQQRSGADPFLVVEVGAGSGSLLRPLMETFATSSSQPSSSPSGGGAERSEAEGVKESYQLPATSHQHEPTHVPPAKGRGDAERSDAGGLPYEFHAVEASPVARKALTELLGSDNVHTSPDDLPDTFNGAIIANELLDNLPCALAIRSGDAWVERRVGATDDRFGFVTAPARSEVAAWCDAYAGIVPEGGMVEVQLAATEWIESALQHIDHGVLVVIDYGGTAEELEPRRTQGTLRTYRSHHLGPDPFLEPGATDVTIDVNFTAMLAAAESVGASAELRRQDDFLSDLGLREQIREFRHRERDLARSGEAMQRLVVRSEATDAETLLHPRGLGDFRVLVARTDWPVGEIR
ncbi:MAG: SAM-dependent methyltransferase [Actinomycetia bacterium]|nr:SAM-dependent methyltransferase [Actinomycetes bacterium]